MAIYHFTTKLVKASKGKCAVASAAYQAAEKLYDERLGQLFSYTHKEEVMYTEILLPQYAPEHLKNRGTLWNEVEKIQNKSNSRYARQFEFSLPLEWSREERIERAREFIQKNFVDKGMIVDWAYHEKDGNPHIHMMGTVRGFNRDGSWALVSRSTYALDAVGNKIPDIDPSTGLQKVRIRKGKGEEKLWLRVNKPTNDWDKRETLLNWRKAWSEYANQFLSLESKIDHRSYKERGIEKIPSLHFAPGMNEMEKRGIISHQIQENRERRRINEFFEAAKKFVTEARMQLEVLKDLIRRRDLKNGKGRSVSENVDYRRFSEYYRRVSGVDIRTVSGPNRTKERVRTATRVQRKGGASHSKVRRHHH